MKETHPYTTLSSKTAYQNPWIRVREDAVRRTDGHESIYGVVETRDSVIVAVLNDKNELYLVNTYSYPDQSWNWEFPGGGGDGEDPVVAGKRELAEETGIIAEQWTLLGKTRVCNGLMTEKMAVYAARDVTLTGRKSQEDQILVREGKFFPLGEVASMVQRGEINDSQSLTAIYLLEQWLARNN